MLAFEKHNLDTEAHQAFLVWWYRIVPYHSYVKGWKIGPSHLANQDLSTVWLDKRPTCAPGKAWPGLTRPLLPGCLGRRVPPGDPAEGQAFADIAGALIEVAVDRAQFSGAVEPRDRRAVGAHDLALLVASRAALRVEHRRRELDRIERLSRDRRQHQPAAEFRVVPASQQRFQRATVSASAPGRAPARAASAARLSAVLIQPFASSALLSSLQS